MPLQTGKQIFRYRFKNKTERPTPRCIKMCRWRILKGSKRMRWEALDMHLHIGLNGWSSEVQEMVMDRRRHAAIQWGKQSERWRRLGRFELNWTEEKQKTTYKRILIRLSAEFSVEIYKGPRSAYYILNAECLQIGAVYPWRLIELKKIKSFSR